MLISVIICTKDRPDDLRRTLQSLAAQRRLPDEVIIVDAGRDLPVPDPASLLPVSVCCRCLPSEPGLTRQRNLGIRQSSGDAVLFLDDDVELEPDYVGEVAAIFEADGEGTIGAVVGRVMNAVPAGKATAGDAVRAAIRRIFLLSDSGDGSVKPSGFPALPHSLDEGRDVQTLSGCCMSFRRSVFTDAAFDERLAGYCYMEDMEIAHQVRARGYRIRYQPAARLLHHISAKARTGDHEVARMLVRNAHYLFCKHRRTSHLHPAAFAWSLIGLMVAAVFGRNMARLAGTVDGVGDILCGRGLDRQSPVAEKP